MKPGKIGAAALSFSGDGTYLQTASESAVKVSSDLSPILGTTSTLDVWVNTTQVGNNTHYMAPAITGVEEATASNDINWGTINASGHIGIYVGDAGGVYSTNALNDGTWHNIAMTRDATTGIVQLYVDGVLNGSGTFDTGNKTSQFFLIGALSDVASDGVTPTGDNYFNGKLDEVRVYNQVLGASEIAGLLHYSVCADAQFGHGGVRLRRATRMDCSVEFHAVYRSGPQDGCERDLHRRGDARR